MAERSSPKILTREFTAVSPGKPKELLDVRDVMLNQSGSPLFEIALVLLRLDQIASGVVNANHGIGAALIG